MLDLGLGKLIIIATVAFIVIGPTRLPTVARAAGLLFARLEKYISGFKSELRQELARAEFAEIEAAYQETKQEVSSTFSIDSLDLSDKKLPAAIKPSLARRTPEKQNTDLSSEQLSLFGEAPSTVLRSEHRDRR